LEYSWGNLEDSWVEYIYDIRERVHRKKGEKVKANELFAVIYRHGYYHGVLKISLN